MGSKETEESVGAVALRLARVRRHIELGGAKFQSSSYCVLIPLASSY